MHEQLNQRLAQSINRATPIHTLYDVCAVPLGVFSTVGGVQYHGGYHEYRGGYHEYCGGYLDYHGGVQYRGGYHDKCGDILSTVGIS